MNLQTRRRFILRSLAAAGATSLIRTAAAATAKSKPDVILYDGEYPGWPWITRGADGTLYVVFREGTVHAYSANGRIMFTASRDAGKSWTAPRVIVDAPEVDDRNVAIVELPDKRLLLTYNTYTKALESQALTRFSADGGATWTAPQPLDLPNTRTRAAAIVLSDGSLLLPYYVAPGSGAVAGLSRDHGRTWKSVRVPDAEGFTGDEWDVLETEPGRLIGLSRNSHKSSDGTFWKTESRDGGATWAVPVKTNVQSQRAKSPAQLIRFGKKPVLIHPDRRMVSISAVRPLDAGCIRWDVGNRHTCYLYNADESPIRDGSYAVAASVGDGRLLIVDYEIRETSKRITGYFAELPAAWKS